MGGRVGVCEVGWEEIADRGGVGVCGAWGDHAWGVYLGCGAATDGEVGGEHCPGA